MTSSSLEVRMQVRSAAELGAQLRKRRKEKGLTQHDLAELCRVSVRFLSEVERGRESASVGLVLRLCSRLGLSVTVSPRESQLNGTSIITTTRVETP